jgi:hypothetical protein
VVRFSISVMTALAPACCLMSPTALDTVYPLFGTSWCSMPANRNFRDSEISFANALDHSFYNSSSRILLRRGEKSQPLLNLPNAPAMLRS